MSGFIAGGDTSAAYPISNADFWPDIDGQQLRAAMRIVPAEQIKGKSQLLHLYCRVIYCGALAELIERYQSFDATNSGEQKVTEEESSPDQLRRDARKALRTILGISHATVELL